MRRKSKKSKGEQTSGDTSPFSWSVFQRLGPQPSASLRNVQGEILPSAG